MFKFRSASKSDPLPSYLAPLREFRHVVFAPEVKTAAETMKTAAETMSHMSGATVHPETLNEARRAGRTPPRAPRSGHGAHRAAHHKSRAS